MRRCVWLVRGTGLAEKWGAQAVAQRVLAAGPVQATECTQRYEMAGPGRSVRPGRHREARRRLPALAAALDGRSGRAEHGALVLEGVFHLGDGDGEPGARGWVEDLGEDRQVETGREAQQAAEQ